MVTRKVARSKRDAVAMAEAQARESDADGNTNQEAKPKSRRAIMTESLAKARAVKATKDAAQRQEKEANPASAAVRPPVVAVAVTPAPVPSTSTTPRSISTRNRGSRPTPIVEGGAVPAALLRKELERKLEFVDAETKARFGELVWAKRAGFPFWPALILDPRLLPAYELHNALKELDVKCWVQLYGSRDIRQILFTALASWDDQTHPYRDGVPKSDFHRLTKLKDTFVVALNEASEHEKLSADERLKVFTTEVVPSLGLPIPAPLPEARKRKSPATTQAQTSSSQANGTAHLSNSTQGGQGGGVQNKAATPVHVHVEKRTPVLITHENRGGGTESRYRIGRLGDYATKLRTILGTQSQDRDWRVQLHLSQLLDEKAFLRRDVEKAGIWELIDEVRANENLRWRDLVETVSTHLKNCTLEEWPSAQRPPIHKSGPPKRSANTPPPLIGTISGSTDPKRQRVSTPSPLEVVPDSSALTPPTLPSSSSSMEAMAEAVARSMISRSTANPAFAVRMATLAPRSDPVTSSSSPEPTTAPFLSSSSAMASVGINPGVTETTSVGAVMFAATAVPAASSTVSSTTATIQPSLPQHSPDSPVNTSQSLPTPPPISSRERPKPSRGSGRANAVTSRATTSVTAAHTAPPQGVSPAFRSNPSLVIFNKDGTLLDFQTTWTSWVESQAWRLETALGRPIRESFFDALGYNPQTRTMRTGSVFNTLPKQELSTKFAVTYLQQFGLQYVEVVRLVNQHWSLPKEVATFRARRDLPSLFKTIRDLGVKIAILTTDRRDVTSKTLTHFGVGHLVDLVSCGDDGMANTHERVWGLCNRLGVSPASTVLVGDTADDMILGRTAGCAFSVGVLGGASDLSDLSAEADFLVPCVTKVIKLLFQYRQQAAARSS